MGRIARVAAAAQSNDDAGAAKIQEKIVQDAESYDGGSGASIRRSAGISETVGGYHAAKAFAAYELAAEFG